MEELKALLEVLINSTTKNLIISAIILIFFIIIDKFIVSRILRLIKKLTQKTKNNFDDIIEAAVKEPITQFIKYIGFYYGILYLALMKKSDIVLEFNNKILKAVIIILITWFIYNLTREKSLVYERMKCRCDNKSNKILFPFVSTTIRIIISVVSISIIAKEFGFSGFITGLGLSGVVFALAAQDTFSNLFGGIVIAFDRPFTIGDWIEAEGIEGVVEEITFRSTRIRTFAKALIIVPNSKLANSNIVNWSKREERRIIFKIPISNKNKSIKILRSIAKIEQRLISNEKVSNESLIVNLDELKLGYNNIFIYCYIPCKDYLEYKKMKQEVNLIILSALEEEHVDLAVNINEIYIKD